MKKVWEQIRALWETGGDLNAAMVAHDISMPDIALRAKSEGWDERGSKKPRIASFDSPVLTDQQVTLAHKTDLGRLRLLAACVMEGMVDETDNKVILNNTEKLAKIYAIIIPLERKVFGMDLGDDDAPSRVVLTKRAAA